MSSNTDAQESDLPRRSSWQSRPQSTVVAHQKNRATQFSGKKKLTLRGWHYRPRPSDQEHQGHTALDESHYGGSLNEDQTGKLKYINEYGQTSVKYSDVAVYLSPTNSVPRRLRVQATDSVIRHDLDIGDWRRCKVSGDVPLVLRISQWALQPFRHRQWYRKVDGCLRVLLASIPIQILLILPDFFSWDNEEDMIDTYTDFPGYYWQWAKHSINPLDEKPRSTLTSSTTNKHEADSHIVSTRHRLLRPRQLVVQQLDKTWKVEATKPDSPPYIFVSFANNAFKDESGRQSIQKMAENAALEAGYQAYWLDFLCRAPKEGNLLDLDVYRMCDVIRGSARVVIMLPDDRIESKIEWGSRMWTLPEALLAPGHQCFLCLPQADRLEALTLVQMTGYLWQGKTDDGEDSEPIRLLAEHFSNLLVLSRLELFSLASSALWRLSQNTYTFKTSSDIAYALMGLLSHRIPRDDTDTEFQSLARLSLSNDNDRIVERMISLYPAINKSIRNPFFTLSAVDRYHTHLWDIKPTCQIVGVAHEDNTVLVDSCRAMHIRWKSFTRPVIARETGFRRFLAIMAASASKWWLATGISLAVVYAPFFVSVLNSATTTVLEWLIAAFLFVAILLSWFGPFAIKYIYGGEALQSASNLVGFEGVMPIADLEKLIFGQNNGRLSYEASSGPFAEHYRDEHMRVGQEPPWVKMVRPEPPSATIPEGHRLFTLVDMGELTVTIFSAERPPTVALICGREGGMLRAVLCSWRFENDCLYKEAVIRMPSNVWDAARPKAWLKLCLMTLNQAKGVEQVLLQQQQQQQQQPQPQPQPQQLRKP